jgi:hypothetical protein
MLTTHVVPTRFSEKVVLKIILLASGILSSLYYVFINIIVPMRFEGYSLVTQTVSELSAIGAPTRPLWVAIATLYILLFAVFGWGVWQSSAGNRPLRMVARLIFAYCVINIYWPPMHLRGTEPSLTDTLHIVWSAIAVLFMMAMMGFGAAALGKRFRIFTIASIALHVVFGILTGIEAPNIATNLPTPLIGVWERINIGIFMLWVIVLAIALLRKENRSHMTCPV